jgi:hypothetical protein
MAANDVYIQVFRLAYGLGYSDGFHDGYAKGLAEGREQGFAAGLAAAAGRLSIDWGGVINAVGNLIQNAGPIIGAAAELFG